VLARSVLYMQPREGCRDQVVKTFSRLGVPERAMAQEGCLSVELQVAVDEQGPVLVTALWESRSAYDGWLNNPWRDESGDELSQLLTEPPSEGVLFDVELAAGDPVAAAEGRA
jgi:quinol monooxygenase YgiN